MSGTDASPSEAGTLRPIAFYLPQFHPIPENDEWWGRGFTEWANVTRARPLFRGHYQPHRPADLGYYDLRVGETRVAQAELARQYGIYGFCYWHYWFNGRRLLERPLTEVVASGAPDFPFMVCWANENWTRTWDGGPDVPLISQNYSEADDRRHMRALAPVLTDRRYITVDGKPALAIYDSGALPDVSRTLQTWRETAQRLGISELYLMRINRRRFGDPVELERGFDAAIEFQPDWQSLYLSMTRPRALRLALRLGRPTVALRGHRIFKYDRVARLASEREAPSYLEYRGVTTNWDNSPRRRRGANILVGSTPERYGQWLRQVATRFAPPSEEENFIFINAWNEWAEGAHLEPDERWGCGYLEATRDALA